MLRKIVAIVVACVLVVVNATTAQARVHHKHVIHGHHIVTEGTFSSCLMDNLIHETRGVHRHDANAARVEITRLLISRTHSGKFPPSVCKVVNQRTYIPSKHKTLCQFSWKCRPQNVEPLKPELVAQMQRSIKEAVALQHRYGDIPALFYTSNGTCPIPAVRRYHKGGFTFCVAAS